MRGSRSHQARGCPFWRPVAGRLGLWPSTATQSSAAFTDHRPALVARRRPEVSGRLPRVTTPRGRAVEALVGWGSRDSPCQSTIGHGWRLVWEGVDNRCTPIARATRPFSKDGLQAKLRLAFPLALPSAMGTEGLVAGWPALRCSAWPKAGQAVFAQESHGLVCALFRALPSAVAHRQGGLVATLF